jgi:hypothetical protein
VSYLDKATPGYEDILTNVSALTAQSDVSASLDVISESGDDENVEALVDWFMQITSKDGNERVTRRRQRVNVRERKIKGSWKIVVIDPVSILAPVAIAAPK